MSSEPPSPPDQPRPTTDGPAAAPPPPPPPAGPSFDAAGQARTLFSQLDSTGYRPTAIVVGVILALFFGSQLLNAIVPAAAVGPGNPGPGGPGSGPGMTFGPVIPGPGSTPLPPGSTLTVGSLRVPLESGWVPQEVPGTNIIVRLAKGSVAIDVLSASIAGQADAAAVYSSYMSELADAATGFGSTSANALQIGSGIPAARGSYTGVFGQFQVEGEVTTFVVGAQGFIFDAWGGSGTLAGSLAEAQRMIDNIQVQ